MLRFLLVFTLLSVTACFHGIENHPSLPSYLAGMTPYLPQQNSDTYEKTPTNCKLIHVAGIFRHGSRFLNSDQAIVLLKNELEKALSQKELLQKGEILLQRVKEVEKIFQEGALTEDGRAQHLALGKRMVRNNPDFFSQKDLKIKISSTFKERSKESRDFFKEGLLSALKNQPKKVDVVTYEKCKDLSLRYFDNCTRYTKYERDFVEPLLKMRRRNMNAVQEIVGTGKNDLAQIFSEKKMKDKNFQSKGWKILDSIYRLCQLEYNLNHKGGGTDFCPLISEDMKKHEFKKVNLLGYYKLGPMSDVINPQYKDVSSNIACMALENVFSGMEKTMRREKDAYAVDLAFGHAETVVPIATFFEIFPKDFLDWSTSEASPMASNIQFLTYECEDSFKIKMLYNEKEFKLPIAACKNSSFCEWKNVKAYYHQRVAEAGMKSCSLEDWGSYCQNISNKKEGVCNSDILNEDAI